ncbi:hypothetical protein O5698_01690 [Escherichia coli]|nr:hypothetical protein [Escherichia coli]
MRLTGEAILLRNITVSATYATTGQRYVRTVNQHHERPAGNKAKELRVSGVIDFNDEAILTRIFFSLLRQQKATVLKHIALLTLPRRQSICDRGYFLVALMPRNNRENALAGYLYSQEKLSVPEKASARSGSQKTIARQQTQNGSEQAPDKGMNTQKFVLEKNQ